MRFPRRLCTETIRVLIPGVSTLDPITGNTTTPEPVQHWCGLGSKQLPDRKNQGFSDTQGGVQTRTSDAEVFLPREALPGRTGFILEVNGELFLPDDPADEMHGAYWLVQCSRAR